MRNLKQFKLTNDDEIVCEVIDSPKDESGKIIIRRALRISSAEDYDNNVRYYSFRPLVSFQDEIDELVVMNVGHIISETIPSKTLVVHYSTAIKEVEKAQSGKRQAFNMDEVFSEIEGLEPEEVHEWLKAKLEKEEQENFSNDSDNPNIIKFNPRGRLH